MARPARGPPTVIRSRSKPPTIRTGWPGSTSARVAGTRTILPSRTEAPAWVGPAAPFDPSEVLACQNGLVHLPSLVAGRDHFVGPTPRFFSPNALDFDFGLDAPEPAEWLSFLRGLWP